MVSGVREGKYSSRELVSACLDRAEQVNDSVNALTEIRAEAALDAADRADSAVTRGDDLGLLHGLPISIKGNVDVAGWATVNGCSAFLDNIASEHSPCAKNWLDAGGILIGRTNTPEFCVRWETENDVYGRTHNPWNPELTPGGSSGGAAASLATGITPLAHGTDLGGSVRHPAQACGVASIRPSLGRVPMCVPSEPEPAMGIQLMNTDGPLARRVADVRLGLQAMVAGDWRDPAWVPALLEDAAVPDLPIALCVNPLGLGVHEQVAGGLNKASEYLNESGYSVEEAEPEALADAVEVWNTLSFWELLNELAPAVKDICGPSLLTAFEHYRAAVPDLTIEKYVQAFADRRAVLRRWMEFFQRYSVLVAPVSTLPPQSFRFDIASPESTLQLIESMCMVYPINGLGLPSAVVPVGIGGGLPQAVQVIGPPFAEMRCLAVAEAIEQHVESLTPIDPR
jgi:amidase